VQKCRRVIGYCRVSTDQQAERGLSLDSQRQQIIGYCSRNELELIDIVVDGGQSGKDLDRPGFQKILGLLASKSVYGVIVAKLDRLSRSIVDICKLVDTYFSDQQYALLSASENIDTKSPAGRMHLYLMSIFAQIERESIVERVTAGLHHYQAQGGKVGCMPYGWRYSQRLDERGNRVVEEDPHQQQAIRRICELFDEGHKARAIGPILDAEGYSPQRGGRWTFNSVWRILTRYGKISPQRRPLVDQRANLASISERALLLRSQGESYPEIARSLNREGLLLAGRVRRWQAATVADLLDRASTRDSRTAYGYACQLRSKGHSLRAIGKMLLAEGFRPVRGEYWHAASVRNLLLSRSA
jgi:DNA invertase Pin-like site-specific DNA recombinase